MGTQTLIADLHVGFRDMRRHQASYQRGGHRSSPRAALLASSAEASAYRASMVWRELSPAVARVLLGGSVLTRPEFREARGKLSDRPSSRLAQELRNLIYPGSGAFPNLSDGELLEPRDFAAYVDHWHDFGMNSIDVSIHYSKPSTDQVRHDLRLAQNSALSAAFLAASLLLVPDPLLINVVRSTLRVPPEVILRAVA